MLVGTVGIVNIRVETCKLIHIGDISLIVGIEDHRRLVVARTFNAFHIFSIVVRTQTGLFNFQLIIAYFDRVGRGRAGTALSIE